jgi:hypothetical protein
MSTHTYVTRSTTRQAEAGKRAAANAVASELNDVLRRVGAQNQTPSASAVRAASQERAKSRPSARGTATAGRQPPASAAAGTTRGYVGASVQRPGALRATGVTPTSTKTTAARTAVNNGASSVTPRSAPAAVGGLGGIRAPPAASTQSAAASPAVVRGDGGNVPLVPADANDRARRMLNVLSQHTDDAELDRVLQQFQQEQANAASQQASKDASADVVKENEDLRRQLATLSMLLSEQMTQRAPLNVVDNADDVIDVGTVSDATDTDDGRAARGRAGRQASQRAVTRNNSPVSRARQPRRVAFASDGQSSADTSDANSGAPANLADGSVANNAKGAKQPASVHSKRGSQNNGADGDGQGHKRQPHLPKPTGNGGNGGGDGDGDDGDSSSNDSWSDDAGDDASDNSSDDDDGRHSRHRRRAMYAVT